MMTFDDQIRALQTEAGGAGDSDMWQICEDALDGNSDARQTCREALTAAGTTPMRDI